MSSERMCAELEDMGVAGQPTTACVLDHMYARLTVGT